jgi:hypothetical protein
MADLLLNRLNLPPGPGKKIRGIPNAPFDLPEQSHYSAFPDDLFKKRPMMICCRDRI